MQDTAENGFLYYLFPYKIIIEVINILKIGSFLHYSVAIFLDRIRCFFKNINTNYLFALNI